MRLAHNGGTYCGPCWKCKTIYWLPQELYDAAQRSEKITFFCPYGHEAIFGKSESKGESESEIVLRRERDRLKQQLAEKDDTIRIERDRLAAASQMLERERKTAARAKKRTAAGTCPCCHRTFRQMALHIKSKHPEFKAEAVA